VSREEEEVEEKEQEEEIEKKWKSKKVGLTPSRNFRISLLRTRV